MINIKIPKIESCSRKICSIKKDPYYSLSDCLDAEIWKEVKEDNEDNKGITQALTNKTKTFCKIYYPDINKKYYPNTNKVNPYYYGPFVWVLRVRKGTEWEYKNVAVCILMNNFSDELNKHIKCLVSITESNKPKDINLLNLWNEGVSEIEFREVVVDRYINSIKPLEWFSDDPFIKSLVFPDLKPVNEPARRIFQKQRASFVEGHIAYTYEMTTNGGLWHDSGYGIDKDIFEYYQQKYSL